MGGITESAAKVAVTAEFRLELARAAWHMVDRGRLRETLQALVDIPSPTGEEGALAEWIVGFLNEAGLDGQLQCMNRTQSNALGCVKGRGNGPSLLLYAPIDTVTANSPDEDLPWIGPVLRDDMRARAWTEGDYILGLGAHNPKGHAACVLEAAAAIRSAGMALEGDLLVGLGAGGMPTEARPGMIGTFGHGAGCEHMLSQIPKPDFAVIAKSGWSVSAEEVGFCWFEVRVKGSHTYVGSRHLLPYRNAILDAARVVARLEQWFPQWTEDNRSGHVAPQGVVSFIEGGWSRMPAFTPAMCRLRVDLRVSPRTTSAEARGRFGAVLSEFASELDIDLEWECLAEVRGTSTSPDSWIIRRCIAGWEAIEEREHRAVGNMSGATDANILRRANIPTARIGLPKVNLPGIDFQLGMNATSVPDLERLTKLLILVAIDTCTRTRAEIHG